MKKNTWIVLVLGILVLIGVMLFTSLQDNPSPTVSAEPQTAKPKAPQAKLPDVIEIKPKPKTVIQPVTQQEPVATTEPSEEPTEDTPEKNRAFVLCEHIISGESQYEFSGEIRLINKGATTVSGWSVNWKYEDESTLLEATDVALSGNNPYTGEYLAWNADIEPGQTVMFSFTGLKGGKNAPLRVKVTGEICI